MSIWDEKANARFELPSGEEIKRKGFVGEIDFGFRLKRTDENSYVLSQEKVWVAKKATRRKKSSDVPGNDISVQIEMSFEKKTKTVTLPRYISAGEASFEISEYYVNIGKNKIFLCSWHGFPMEMIIHDFNGDKFVMEFIYGHAYLKDSEGKAVRKELGINSVTKLEFTVRDKENYQFTYLGQVYDSKEGRMVQAETAEMVLEARYSLLDGKAFMNMREDANYSLKRISEDTYLLGVGTFDYAQIEMRLERRSRMHTQPAYVSFGAATMREYYENLENEKAFADKPPITYEIVEYYAIIGKNEVRICGEHDFPVELAIYSVPPTRELGFVVEFRYGSICGGDLEQWIAVSNTTSEWLFTVLPSVGRYRFERYDSSSTFGHVSIYGSVYDSVEGEMKKNDDTFSNNVNLETKASENENNVFVLR